MATLQLTKKDINYFLNLALEGGYSSEEEAKEDLESFIKNAQKLPNNLILYRLIFLDNKEEFNDDEPGAHYVLSEKKLKADHYTSYLYDFNTQGKSKLYALKVEAPKSLIDFKETIKNRMLYPHEEEITLKNHGKGVKVLALTEI